MPGAPRIELRHLFDESPERYARVRPRYPTAIFDEIAAYGRLGPGSRVLEIGCGTGQATLDLAERGYRVVAVELGARLAAAARSVLDGHPAVAVVNADFESWPLPEEPFDAVVVATAFHWLDPATRVGRATDALRPGGTLAIVETDHVVGGTEAFFVESQDCYLRWEAATRKGYRLPSAADVPVDTAEIAAEPRLEALAVHRYETDIEYGSSDYAELLLTYSDNLALDPAARAGLVDCIAALIDTRYGGRIVKRYLRTLRLARRSPSSTAAGGSG